MLAKNQVLECEIDRLGYRGEGIGRVESLVVFVPFALPGEWVRIRIDSLHKRHAQATLLELLKPSPERQPAPCPVFGLCGGCAMQHLPYAAQLEVKRQAVRDSLKKTAGLDIQVQPVIGAEQPWYYRNKTTWQVRQISGKPQAGFFGVGSHDLVPTDHCFIADETHNAAIQAVLAWMRSEGISGERAGKDGFAIRKVVTRSNHAGQLMVSLVHSGQDLPALDALVSGLRQSVPSLIALLSTRHNITDDEAGLMGTRLQFGQPFMTPHLAGLDFRLSPGSFFQVHLDISTRMYDHALRQAIHKKTDRLFDLYSGTGTLSLLAAQRCAKVIGIELNPAAVRDSRANAQANQQSNVRFEQGLAEQVLPRLVAQGTVADAILLDPPRKGAHPAVLDAILQVLPQRIVYISCHPGSQARDAARLVAGGYTIHDCQPFDMFCQTAEIENIITFVRSAT